MIKQTGFVYFSKNRNKWLYLDPQGYSRYDQFRIEKTFGENILYTNKKTMEYDFEMFSKYNPNLVNGYDWKIVEVELSFKYL